jgi:DNA-binding beta-propeller fold protein YncE
MTRIPAWPSPSANATLLALTLLALTFLMGCGAPAAEDAKGPEASISDAARVAPIFEVDPFWPQPLPNHWVTGSTIGIAVDAEDNVWTLHRPGSVEDNFRAADLTAAEAIDDEVEPAAARQTGGGDPIGVCCSVAPPVLVYGQAGELIRAWGGPGAGYDWPDSNHGITVDHEGNVWLGGNGRSDTQILKFTGDGAFLMQIGTHGVHEGSNDIANFWQPTKIFDVPSAGEIYVSDGYGNRRVIVLDAQTGAYRRHWGAYGAKPDDAPRPPYDPTVEPSDQFSTVHCVIVSDDGFVYVCDRVNDRIQVFRTDGTYVMEALVDARTYRSGSVWDLAFSRDPEQTYIYAANGVDQKINILLRSTLEVLTSFGDGGRQPGQFFGVHNLATDSQGNLYTAETYTGARVQRFLFKGVGPVTEAEQGVVWPEARPGR